MRGTFLSVPLFTILTFIAPSTILPFARLNDALGHLPDEQVEHVRQAYNLALTAHEGQKREDGTPYVNHVIETALIVASWHGDAETIIAALLHDVLEDTTVGKAQITELFGRHVALLVEGVTKFSKADFSHYESLDTKIETVRRLFEVMRRDIRVIIIKLADRLHNIRTIHFLEGERKTRFAKETMDIYYKLALHLGMRAVRREYSEACVPLVYAHGEACRTRQREALRSGEHLRNAMRAELSQHSFDGALVDFFIQPHDAYTALKLSEDTSATGCDAFSIVAVVRTDEDCYQLLKALHTLYRPLHTRFRDYISLPTDAGYQSLHTTITLPSGDAVEVRIRTPSMHEQAEQGITTALFRGGAMDPLARFPWLKRSEALDLKTRESSQAFWHGLESDILQESIIVTVNGSRISLPKGATALDAAYAMCGAGANATTGIRVAGRAVSLAQTLHDDDIVHVERGDTDIVHFEWLMYVVTSSARGHIVDVLKKRNREEKMVLGAKLLQQEMDRYHRGLIHEIRKAERQRVAEGCRRTSFDDVIAMIGEGSLRPRDVVFSLFPLVSAQKANASQQLSRYKFRLSISGVQERQQDVLSSLIALSRERGIDIRHTRIRFDGTTGIFSIMLIGSAKDRFHYADFVDALERQDAISTVQSRVPHRDNIMIVGVLCLSFLFLLADIIFLPQYQYWSPSVGIPQTVMLVLPLLPVLIANTLLLRLLQQHIVRMRTDRWYIGAGFLLNIVALLLMVLRLMSTQSTVSLLPLLGLFVLSLLFIGYRFIQAEALFATIEKPLAKPLSRAESKMIARRKAVGYCIRFIAIAIWGLEPIYIKYTPANDLSPFLRTFLLGLGVLIPSAIVYGLRRIVSRKPAVDFSIVYDRYFVILVIGQIGIMYFKNASLLYTSGTNLLLFNNFAPVIGLLIAAVFWRKDIPYLRSPKTILAIFLLGILAGFGSSILVYNTTNFSPSSAILGDLLAMIATFFDVLVTVGQIEYIKRFRSVDGIVLNMHIFFFLLCCTAPALIFLSLFDASILHSLSVTTLLFGLGIGLFVGIGQMLNYAAFKRIDGYLAYMMFNLSMLITFALEAFVIHSVSPTPLLLLSAACIVGASVMAEIVNSRCERHI